MTTPELAPTTDPAGAAEVFYDGACPICRREIAVYRGLAARDPKSALADPAAWRDVADQSDAPDGLDRATLLKRFHVRRADGEIVSGARAFVAVWRATPRLALLGRLADRQPFLIFGEGLYRLFLWVRPLWRRG